MTVPIQKILLLRFSSLGDILMTTAMIRVVRKKFPMARIDFAVREDFSGLLENNPHLDKVWTIARGSGIAGLLKMSRALSREHYDLIYDAHRSLRSRFLMAAVKARQKISFPKHYLRRSVALTLKFPKLTDRTRMLERFIDPLKALGVSYDGKGPEFHVTEAQKITARSKIADATPAESFIGIVPTAQWAGKRWAPERFRDLIAQALKETSQRVIVFAGKADEFCDELVEGLPEQRVINLRGKTSLGESAYWLSRCSVVVANDTGLMHLADALGVPTIVVFGPTSGELGCLPFHPQSVNLEPSLWCRPCSKNGEAPCIRGRRLCLETTKVEEVMVPLRQLALESRARG